jgi:hypothetical protein
MTFKRFAWAGGDARLPSDERFYSVRSNMT